MPTTQVANLYRAFRAYSTYLNNINGVRFRSLAMDIHTPGCVADLLYLVHRGTYNMPLSHTVSVNLMDIRYVHSASHFIYYYWLQASTNVQRNSTPV